MTKYILGYLSAPVIVTVLYFLGAEYFDIKKAATIFIVISVIWGLILPGDKVYAVIRNTRPCLGIVSHQLSAGIGKDKRIEIERDQEISMA
ncbi:hypothetical protein LCGC14_1618160 [marine sediment metagenome]|uniref:Uncharacterized protein n=1 Tax=marine sediment metagenome TaxID=412755 RepID=A0A0F9IT62_9ZZZZ